MADIARFLRPDVQRLLQHVDEAGVIFTKRWNDLIIQSVAVQLFVAKERVHHFRGWSYGHNSGGHHPQDGRLYAGLFQIGLDESAPILAMLWVLRRLRSREWGRTLRATEEAYMNLSTINHGALTIARPGVCTRARQGAMPARGGSSSSCSCAHLFPAGRRGQRIAKKLNPLFQWVLC